MSEFEGAPSTYPPLGMPTGSVRALLTLIVIAVVVSNLAQGREIDVLWIETLLIALAHYFASRRFVALPPGVLARLEQEGVIEREQNPLFLPKHSIRFLILAAFSGLAAHLYQQQKLFNDPKALSFLGIVFTYMFGCFVGGVKRFFFRRRVSPPSRIWRDGMAILVLLCLLAVAVPEFLGQGEGLHPDVRKVALGLMLFYFGSR